MLNVNFILQKKLKPRKLFSTVLKFLHRNEAIVITGPRQAGKTSLLFLIVQFIVRNGLGKVFFYDLEDPTDLQLWQDLSFLRSFPSGSYIFIDEIQYHPDPAKLMKLAVDHRSGEIKLFVSGSSSLQIKSKFSATTVGRKVEFLILPLDFEEFLIFKDREDLARFLDKAPIETILPLLEEFITFGGYPAVCLAPDKETKTTLMSEIFSSYLYKDIFPLFQLRKIEAFSKLVRLLAARIGKPVSLNSIAAEIGISRQTLTSYIEALKLTYILLPVQPFSTNPSTEIRKASKYYFADTGLRNWAILNFEPLSFRSDSGPLAENTAFLEIFKNIPHHIPVGYWKKKTGAEVDFVLNRKIPVEIKYTAFKKLTISKSFRAFLDKFSPEIAFIVTRETKGKLNYNNTKINFLPLYLTRSITTKL